MDILFALLIAVIATIIYEILPKLRENYAEAKVNRNTSVALQETFKKTRTKIIVSIVAIAVAAILAVTCFVIYANEPKASSSSSKGKCAMCGKTTSLSGSFCGSCNDKAFGSDGWYDKIKD